MLSLWVTHYYLYERAQGKQFTLYSPSVPLPVSTQRSLYLGKRKLFSLDTDSDDDFIWEFSALRTVRNAFILFVNHPATGVDM